MSWDIGSSRNIYLSLRDKSKIFQVRSHHELKRYSYTVLEAQNFPNLDNFDVESQISEFKWDIHNGLRRANLAYRSDKQELFISQHRWKGYQWSFLTKIGLKKRVVEKTSRSSTNSSFLYRKLQRDLLNFGRNNSELMNIVTLVNIFPIVTEAYFQCVLQTKNENSVFSQLVKFVTEMSIWTKLIKSFLTEEELDMETLFWIFS